MIRNSRVNYSGLKDIFSGRMWSIKAEVLLRVTLVGYGMNCNKKLGSLGGDAFFCLECNCHLEKD